MMYLHLHCLCENNFVSNCSITLSPFFVIRDNDNRRADVRRDQIHSDSRGKAQGEYFRTLIKFGREKSLELA